MSNTAFFFATLPFFLARFLFIFLFLFLDSPRFSSILLDSPRFSSILLDFPRFSSILLDSPRFSSILLDCFRLLFVGKSNTNFATCAIFSPFSIFGGLSSPQLDILHTFEPFSSKNCKIAFFFLAKSATLHHFWPFASKTCNTGHFCTKGPFSPFFLPKVAKLPVFVPEQLFSTIRVESARFISISIFF